MELDRDQGATEVELPDILGDGSLAEKELDEITVELVQARRNRIEVETLYRQVSTLKGQPIEAFGSIPAAGMATRLGPLPFSKELFPLALPQGTHRLRPVCESILRNMRSSGIARVIIVIRQGKWDIPGRSKP